MYGSLIDSVTELPCLVLTAVRFRGRRLPDKGRETTMSKGSKEITEDARSDEVPLKTLLETVVRQNDVAEIHVDHLIGNSNLYITVHTGDANSYEEYLDVVAATHVLIDVDGAEALRRPYTVTATFGGPGHPQGEEGTTVFRADNVLGAKAIEMDSGLIRLEQKLSGFCPACGVQPESLRKHFREQRTCAEQEYTA